MGRGRSWIDRVEGIFLWMAAGELWMRDLLDSVRLEERAVLLQEAADNSSVLRKTYDYMSEGAYIKRQTMRVELSGAKLYHIYT